VVANGGFAEYVAVLAANVARARQRALEVAGVMELLGNAVHTAFSGALGPHHRRHRLRPDRAVRGRGGARGRRVHGDRQRRRPTARAARRMQADAVINGAEESFVDRVRIDRRQYAGRGAGIRAARRRCATASARADARASSRRWAPQERSNWTGTGCSSSRIRSTASSGGACDTWYQMDNLLRGGRLDIRPAITHVMPMSRFDEAIALLKGGNAGKVVLIPWGQEGGDV
jgi:threonine 3-dehydrogenase